jgi:hypothetical protein
VEKRVLLARGREVGEKGQRPKVIEYSIVSFLSKNSNPNSEQKMVKRRKRKTEEEGAD